MQRKGVQKWDGDECRIQILSKKKKNQRCYSGLQMEIFPCVKGESHALCFVSFKLKALRSLSERCEGTCTANHLSYWGNHVYSPSNHIPQHDHLMLT